MRECNRNGPGEYRLSEVRQAEKDISLTLHNLKINTPGYKADPSIHKFKSLSAYIVS